MQNASILLYTLRRILPSGTIIFGGALNKDLRDLQGKCVLQVVFMRFLSRFGKMLLLPVLAGGGALQARLGEVESMIQKSYRMDSQKAIRSLVSLRKRYPRDARLSYRIAWLYHKMNRRPEALKYYKKTISLEPCHARAWNNTGNLALDDGKPGPAEKAYRKAIHCNPKLASAWYNLANQLRKKDQLQAALRAYQKTLSLKPKHHRANHNIALVYIRLLQDLPQTQRANSPFFLFAQKHLTKAIELKRRDPYGWYNRGRLYELAGYKSKAKNDYRMAFRLSPSGSAFRGRILQMIQRASK